MPVRAADLDLPAVLQVPLIDGRWLNTADTPLHTRSACSDRVSPSSTDTYRGEDPHDPAQRHQLRRRRRARPGRARPQPRQRRVHHAVAGQARTSRPTGSPTSSTCGRRPATTQETANAIPTAISLGGTDQTSTNVPSDVLQAASQANKTLQQTALFAGLLALSVGGLGIANVMSISVIQRSSEIGIRTGRGPQPRPRSACSSCSSRCSSACSVGSSEPRSGVGVIYLVSALRALGRGGRLQPRSRSG